MLKHLDFRIIGAIIPPAAFGRLCVETRTAITQTRTATPAAFGRLCVETLPECSVVDQMSAAAFGRLCVETLNALLLNSFQVVSRLRAAVC